MTAQTSHTDWTTILCDSLEKVFPDQEPRAIDSGVPIIAFRGELAGFQVAIRPPRARDAVRLGDVRVSVAAPNAVTTTVSAVDLVPVELPAFEDADPGYLRTAPGLFPDLLRPVESGVIQPVVGQWRAAWVDIEAGEGAVAGDHFVHVTLTSTLDDSIIAQHAVPVRIPQTSLPELGIPHTEWFHCDGIADYYGSEVFSEEHWAAIENFMVSARRAQANMVLTPIWTPSLDTEIGSFRTETQLLGIRETDTDSYQFDFSGLRRWMLTAERAGMRYLEIAHFFSQWGAQATPPIYVDTADGRVRRFGWDVAATDPRYRLFLEQLIPQLRAVLDEGWGLERVYFHISDEPSASDVASYAAARAAVDDLLEGCTVIDALAEIELYREGLVPYPVVANDHAAPFLEAGVSPMWLYYCVAQNKDVSNRFIALPSARNRVIGTQLFLTGAAGFLHWGFNFYNSFLSRRRIDPFRDTCAGGGFPGGDPFLVYPGPGGQAWESVRHRVLAEAFIDYRALMLLAERSGTEAATAIADPESSIRLDSYTYDPTHYRRVLRDVAVQLDAAQ